MDSTNNYTRLVAVFYNLPLPCKSSLAVYMNNDVVNILPPPPPHATVCANFQENFWLGVHYYVCRISSAPPLRKSYW